MSQSLNKLTPPKALNWLMSRVAKLINDYKQKDYEFRMRIKQMNPVEVFGKVNETNNKLDLLLEKMVLLIQRVEVIHDYKITTCILTSYLIDETINDTLLLEQRLKTYAIVITDMNEYSKGD